MSAKIVAALFGLVACASLSLVALAGTCNLLPAYALMLPGNPGSELGSTLGANPGPPATPPPSLNVASINDPGWRWYPEGPRELRLAFATKTLGAGNVDIDPPAILSAAERLIVPRMQWYAAYKFLSPRPRFQHLLNCESGTVVKAHYWADYVFSPTNAAAVCRQENAEAEGIQRVLNLVSYPVHAVQQWDDPDYVITLNVTPHGFDANGRNPTTVDVDATLTYTGTWTNGGAWTADLDLGEDDVVDVTDPSASVAVFEAIADEATLAVRAALYLADTSKPIVNAPNMSDSLQELRLYGNAFYGCTGMHTVGLTGSPGGVLPASYLATKMQTQMIGSSSGGVFLGGSSSWYVDYWGLAPDTDADAASPLTENGSTPPP